MPAIPPYPVKRPAAATVAAVTDNSVGELICSKLQERRVENGVAKFYVTRSSVNKAAKDLTSPEDKVLLKNVQRFFSQNKDLKEVGRDTLFSWLSTQTRDPMIKAAGKDGILSDKEAAKLPKYLRDDFEFATGHVLKK